MSTSPTRTPSILLEGASLTGSRYVFVGAETGISRVRFWLDDPIRAGPPSQTESNAPWDFRGSTADGTPRAWNTAAVFPGEHAITAAVERTNGTTTVLTSRFTVG